MPWKESHVMNERMSFIVRVESGEKVKDLCEEYGISRKTGHKFLQRYREYGPLGLFDESRRPHRLARKYPDEIRSRVIQSKKAHPTWGAKKLHAKLNQIEGITNLPCEGTVHSWLEQEGLVKKRGRKRYKSNLHRVVGGVSKGPNDIWSADFKGEFRVGNGKYCYPLTISDHYSRYLVSCEGLESPNGIGGRRVFDEAFRRYGLPNAIRTDNGTPFVGRGLGGLSKLSIWWLKLGIKIQRIEPGHPEQNGRHERMHLTLKQETTRPAGKNLLQQQERFDNFIEEYNTKRPHEALKMQSPAKVYKPSSREYPKETP